MLPINMMGLGMNSETAFPMMQMMALNGMGGASGMGGAGRGSDCCNFSSMGGQFGMGGASANPMMSLIMGGCDAAGGDYFTRICQQMLANVGQDPSIMMGLWSGSTSMAMGMDMTESMGDPTTAMQKLMSGVGGGMNFGSMMGGMSGMGSFV